MVTFGEKVRRFVFGQENLWDIYKKNGIISKGLTVRGPNKILYETGEQEYCAPMDEAGVLLYPIKRGFDVTEPLLVESELREYAVVQC